jgi:hypothetical protein
VTRLYDGSHVCSVLWTVALRSQNGPRADTTLPPGAADMDYFHSPPDVASPLRRVSMATVSSQFHG